MRVQNKLQTTTTQLLDSLNDPSNQDVWVDLDARFRGIIEGVARRLGLRPEDAADVAQETLTSFVRDYRRGSYNRGQGRLRTWLMSIARHRAIDMLRQSDRDPNACADSALLEVPSESQVQAIWDMEEERAIFDAAFLELRRTTHSDAVTLRMFELTAVQGMSSEAAAVECKSTPEQARKAKHRITNQLREIVNQMTAAYQEDQ